MAAEATTPTTLVEETTVVGETPARTVGAVTTGAGAGSAIGGALATLIVAIFKLDLTPEGVASLTTVLSVGLAVLGGYLVPSQRGQMQEQVLAAVALTQEEREDMVESAARNAASLAVPTSQMVAAQVREVLAEYQLTPTETTAPELTGSTVADDPGAGLRAYEVK